MMAFYYDYYTTTACSSRTIGISRQRLVVASFFFLKGTIRNGYKGMRKQASDLHFPTQTLGREWVHGNAVVASTHHNHHLIITFSSSSFFSDKYFSQILDSQFISYVIFCIVFLGSSRMIPDWERDDGIDVTSSRQERRRISGSPSF